MSTRPFGRMWRRAVLGLALAACFSEKPGIDPKSPVAWGELSELQVQLEGDATAVHLRDQRGRTVLHIGSMWGDTALVTLALAKGAELTAVDVDGRTALHTASLYGRADAVVTLLQAGADVDPIDEDLGVTPLHLAAASIDETS